MSIYQKRIFAALLGALYLLAGAATLIAVAIPEIGIIEILGITGDPAGGFILIVIGGTLFYGYLELSRGINEGVAFLHVGIALALVFGMIRLLSIGAEFATMALFEDEMITLGMLREELVPVLYLAVIALAGFIAWGKEFSAGLLRG
ncbi:hypothetical protein J2T58_001314 [Methanocalculus alkaliphilus]|uniref:hypothetical protein n=1 Tax=Methanocalculus alkaliphilus TaxID=768730 RepID=UPI00209F3425|nr:hypothetical protein [Methanocalculus alkaliphilus]MCP1715449.1 hypothetical protein [Methanocalculus alkaliphilus]